MKHSAKKYSTMNKLIIKQQQTLQQQSGFTLLEILVALVLGVGILVAAITMQVQHRQGFGLTSNKLEMQTNAKFAFEFIGKSLRSAGSVGCRNSASLDDTDIGGGKSKIYISFNDPTVAYADFRSGFEVLGYEYLGAGLTPVPPIAFTFVASSYYNTDSDVLTVAGGYGEVYSLDEAAIAQDDPGMQLDMLNVTDVRLKQSQYGMVSSCTGVKIFKVTSSDADIGLGKIQWGGGGAADDNETGLYGYKANVVGSGSQREFRRAAVVTYFVGMNPLGDSVNGVPTLYQDVDGVSSALIEGVEEIQVLYGLSEGAVQRNIADQYLTADVIDSMAPNSAEWAKVVSVRIGLIMRSSEPVYGSAIAQNIDLACVGYTQTTKTDRYARSTYCSEVSLRNRLTGTRVGTR